MFHGIFDTFVIGKRIRVLAAFLLMEDYIIPVHIMFVIATFLFTMIKDTVTTKCFLNNSMSRQIGGMIGTVSSIIGAQVITGRIVGGRPHTIPSTPIQETVLWLERQRVTKGICNGP